MTRKIEQRRIASDNLNPLAIDEKKLARKIETKRVAIFQFFCPKCKELVYEGTVCFDMEDSCYECNSCEFTAVDLWDFIFTIKGSGIYGIHGLFTNDGLPDYDLNTVIRQFLFKEDGHGSWGKRFYSYNIDEVVEFAKKEAEENS